MTVCTQQHVTQNVMRTTTALLFCVLLTTVMLAGCGKSEEAAKSLPPIAIEPGDECHVCGMIISNYPGPKGEAYVRNSDVPFKFCSTRDLFSFVLQPENKVNVTQIYVHDMGSTSWKQPSDGAFVDAHSAWYVADQPMKGAMGPTLASFKSEADARKFIGKNGGHLLRFDDITLDILAKLGQGTSKQ